MKTIKTINGTQPILEITEEGSRLMGLSRDRFPDSGWNELRRTNMQGGNVREVELTDELLKTCMEDLAYAFGSNSSEYSKAVDAFLNRIVDSRSNVKEGKSYKIHFPEFMAPKKLHVTHVIPSKVYSDVTHVIYKRWNKRWWVESMCSLEYFENYIVTNKH